MRTIQNKNVILEAEGYSNSKTWGHKARAIYNGRIVAENKIRYHNRTWEAYEFDTILSCLIDKLDKDKVVPLSDRLELTRLIK